MTDTNKPAVVQPPKIFIKFILTNGEISVDEEQAKAILKSEAQLIPIRDEAGAWTHETINKAFIVRTIKDTDRIRHWYSEQKRKEDYRIAEDERQRLANLSPEERAKIEEEEKERRAKTAKMFEDLRNKMHIKPA